ncbi:carbohydrate-binding protein, partial [Myceligenerans indicum]|uniref:carbohydrate-binding protein n=1 Tax=Myceligenerans indicum TaxID=2593663 RepID=UPI003557F3D3
MDTQQVRRRRTRGGLALATALTLVVGGAVATAAAQAQDTGAQATAAECATPWSSSDVYVQGDTVSYGEHDWQAKWWTQGDTPGAGEWGPWEDQGTCGGGSTDPGTPPSGECTSAGWDASAVYVGGDTASYASHEWQAQWWTQGETPGAADVWADLGACSGGPGPTPVSYTHL